MPIAVVIDGAYFLRRFRSRYPTLDASNPTDVAFGVVWLAAAHLALRFQRELPKIVTKDNTIISMEMSCIESSELYRIFFYDCPPLTKRTQLPISKKNLDLSQTDVAKSRLAIYERLLMVRKVALRRGRLNEKFGWRPKPEAVDRWLTKGSEFNPVDDDFELNTVQKGVDMRLGLDVASLAFKRQVDQIVLVAGDSDFVPAAKLARREGIDVVLDPMGGTPAKDLVEHVDGIRQVDRVVSP